MLKKKFDRTMRRRGGLAAMLCVMSLGLAACGETAPMEEESGDSTVIVENEKPQNLYKLKVVGRADVIKTETIRCSVKQVNEEKITYEEDGKKIALVHVKAGDQVKKGQLLFEMESSGTEDEIRQMEYEINRMKLQLSYIDINLEYEKSRRSWRFAYQSSGTTADDEKLASDLADMEQSARYQKEDLQDSIEMAQIRLDRLKEEYAAGQVRAGMDGVITMMSEGLVEGAVTEEGKTVIKIVDSSVSLFGNDKAEYGKYFKADEVVTMMLGVGKSAKEVNVVPYDYENWENGILFEVIKDENTPTIEATSRGTITLELERREQVLALPAHTVHTANGRTYVYVLDENEIQQVRWIETGLQGDGMIEIVSGLTEGESVVLK